MITIYVNIPNALLGKNGWIRVEDRRFPFDMIQQIAVRCFKITVAVTLRVVMDTPSFGGSIKVTFVE